METTLNNRVNEGGRPKDSWVLNIHIPLIHLDSILMSLLIPSTFGSTWAYELQKVYIMTNPSVWLSLARKDTSTEVQMWNWTTLVRGVYLLQTNRTLMTTTRVRSPDDSLQWAKIHHSSSAHEAHILAGENGQIHVLVQRVRKVTNKEEVGQVQLERKFVEALWD